MLDDWSRRIDQAIAAHSLIFYCQPIISINDPSVVYEILVRLEEPSGIVPAAEFIAAASSQQLSKIDRLALVQTLEHLKTSDTIHTINLSGSTIADLTFPAFVSEQLSKSGVSPRLLWIEVTEQIPLTEPSVQVLSALRDLRLLVGQDDYGAGTATIAAMLEIQPNFLKVDGDIVRLLLQSHLHECVVFGAMALAHRRDIPLILEHVETGLLESRILTLARHFPGLQLMLQGYLYGKPEPC